MLKIDSKLMGMVIFMTDSVILAATVKTTLLEISSQSAKLAAGLQMHSPDNQLSGSGKYLALAAENCANKAEECGKKFLPDSTQGVSK
jgi:hypothetical protein